MKKSSLHSSTWKSSSVRIIPLQSQLLPWFCASATTAPWVREISIAFEGVACCSFQDISGLFPSRLPWTCGLKLHSSVSTSWFSSSSVSTSGSAESRLAPRSLTKQGWLKFRRIASSFMNSFMVFSLLSSSSRSTFSCFAAIKLPFQLAMDTVLLQVVQSSFFTMTSLGSTSKDRSLRWLEIDATLISRTSSLESRPVWVLAELKSLAPSESLELHKAAGLESSAASWASLNWQPSVALCWLSCTSYPRGSTLAIPLHTAPICTGCNQSL